METSTPNIWQMQMRRDIAGLIEALTHDEAVVRKRAAAALRILDAVEAIPALQAALAVEEDWQAQANLSAVLQYLSRGERLEDLIAHGDVDGLTEALRSPQTKRAIGAAKALGNLGDQTASEALVAAFHNAALADDVRLAVAEALLKLQSAPAVVTLLAALRRSEWQSRRNAAAVLGQLNATWATGALIEALDDENPVVQRTARAALERIGTPAARQALMRFDDQNR